MRCTTCCRPYTDATGALLHVRIRPIGVECITFASKHLAPIKATGKIPADLRIWWVENQLKFTFTLVYTILCIEQVKFLCRGTQMRNIRQVDMRIIKPGKWLVARGRTSGYEFLLQLALGHVQQVQSERVRCRTHDEH